MARSTSRPVVGLDIGSLGIRAVELSGEPGHWTMERAASADLARGSVVNGAVRDPKAVADTLRTVWKQGRFTSSRVRFGITNSVIMTRRADLPWMAPSDFRRALPYLVADILPVDLATVQLDYHPLEELEGVDEHGNVVETSRVLLVAADTQLVTDLAEVVRRARLEPTGADNDAFALVRVATGGVFTGTGGPDAVVDIGANQLTVVVHSGGRPAFVRTVANVGGDVVTLEISDRLGLSVDDAEDLKRVTGLNGPAPVLAPLAESSVFGGLATAESPMINPRVAAALDIINPWASTVIGELRNSLEYFRASEGGTPVKSLTVVGQGALLEGLVDRMRTQLRLPITVLPPTLGLSLGKRLAAQPPSDNRFAVAAGLAMGIQP